MSTSIVKPVNAQGGSPATFGVKSDVIGPWKYQWTRNGLNIGGSHWASMTTPMLVADDFKAAYAVTVFGQNTTETSEPVVLDAPVAKTEVAEKGEVKGKPPAPPAPPEKK